METTDSSETKPQERSDPLLECLFIIGQFYGKKISKVSLISGLPLANNLLTPQLFIRAAERVGFQCKMIKRELKQISKLVLPVVLILKNNNACLLNKIMDDGLVEVVLPELSGKPTRISYTELAENYAGFAILLKPLVTAETKPVEEIEKNKSWFWGTLWNFRASYTETLLAALFINIFALVSPLFVMNVYDRVVPNNAEVTLWVLSIGVIIIYSFDFFLRYLRGLVIDTVGKKADLLITSSIYQRLLDLQLQYKPLSAGIFANTLREFETVRDFFTSAALITVIDMPFVVLYLIVIWYVGGPIVWVPLLAIPALLVVSWLINHPLQQHVKSALQSSAKRHALLIETLTGMETIKSLNAAGKMLNRWEQHVSENAQSSLKSRLYSLSLINFAYYVQQIVTIGTIIVGVYLIFNQQMSLGGLIACNILAGRVLAPLGQLANLLTRFQQARNALQNLDKIMQLPIEHAAEKNFLHIKTNHFDVEFKDVSFQYVLQPHKALDNINLKFSVGEKIAIVGALGSGKSTLEKLLLSFYPPQSGAIYINGIDISQLDPSELRSHISYVPQDILLFAGTVYSNIAMGNSQTSDADVIQVAELTGVKNLVAAHPSGFDMPIGERGEGLSGGQRQLVVIARALINKAPLLLMDEPTSAMDEMSEKQFIKNMQNYIKDKSLILVTHKASLLTLVDRIIVLDKGRVVMDGPKDQILQKIATPKPVTHNIKLK